MLDSCSIRASTHRVSLRHTGLFLLQPESVCSFRHESTLSRIDIVRRYRFVGYAHRDRIAVYSDIDSSPRRPLAGIDPEGFWLCICRSPRPGGWILYVEYRIDIVRRYRFVGYAHRDRIAVYSDIDSSPRRPLAGIDPEGFWLCICRSPRPGGWILYVESTKNY